jgi:hypothetical protein
MPVAVRQISISLDEELLQFLDLWRDQPWQSGLAEAYAALGEADADRQANPSTPDALIAAREASELARTPS